jgi:hypothetical protein
MRPAHLDLLLTQRNTRALQVGLNLLARGIHIFSLSFVVNQFRISKIKFQDQVVLWFSGLRGIISFALALNVPPGNDNLIVPVTLLVRKRSSCCKKKLTPASGHAAHHAAVCCGKYPFAFLDQKPDVALPRKEQLLLSTPCCLWLHLLRQQRR